MAKKILLITGDMVEAQEIFYPLHRLREEGYTVHIAAPTKKTLQTVVHDFEPGIDTFTEKFGYRIPADIGFDEVKPEDYDAALIPGGRAPEHIRNYPKFAAIATHFARSGKPLAFECHAPLALLPLGLLKGRRCAAFWALKPDLEANGCTFVDEEVVVDGNYVTSRAWIDHPGFLREFIRKVESRKAEVDKPKVVAKAGSKA